MEISGIAIQSLDQAEGRFELAAGQIASAGANPVDGTPVDTADLSQAAVALLSAKTDFSASLKLFKIADEMQRQVIDIMA